MIRRAPLTTREQWLEAAYLALRPSLLSVSLSPPLSIHVSVGFPSIGGLRSKSRVLGECWGVQASEDKIPHIFISPLISEGTRALDILLHEMIHASGIKGHRADFARPARLLGLEGPPTHTVAGAELLRRLNGLQARIGPYPHKALTGDSEHKKQGTRLLKSECEDCGAIIRVTRKLIDDPGLPTCACGGCFGVE